MKRPASVPAFIAVALALVFARAARAEPIRVLVAASRSEGLEGERPLRHTLEDARRVRDVFTQLGGVRPENALMLEEPTPAQLDAALDRARAIAQTHRPDEVTLVVYFSGHGDHESIHLGRSVIPLAELQARIAAVPATFKIVVVDACRSVELRPKGLSTEEPFAISLSSGPPATGAVWLHASADGEAAQESDRLGGAVFTHYWTDGLRGAADTNGDARVTLSESYDFAYGETLFHTAQASGVVQRPAASFAMNQAYPVVLTQTLGTSSLVFPRSAGTRYLVYARGSHTLAGELWASPERSVRLALPAGQYVIQRQANGAGGALELSLGTGERRDLATSEFRPFAPDELAQKGGDLVVAPQELALGYGVQSGRLYDVGQSVRAQYAYRFGLLAIAAGIEGGLGSQSTIAEDVNLAWFGAAAHLEIWIPVGRWGLRFGAGPVGQYIVQRLRRQDASRVALAGYATEESFHALAWGGELAGGVRAPLSSRLSLGLDLTGRALVANAAANAAAYLSAGAAANIGYGF
jgi:hypothetical protein